MLTLFATVDGSPRTMRVMKRSFLHLSSIAIVLSVTFSNSDSIAQRRTGQGCPANIQRDILEQELERSASAALEAIRSGKPERLMPLLAAKGVVLGVDGPLVRLSAIHKEMSNRTGIYCVIYDSSCLRKEVSESRKKAGAPPQEPNKIMSFTDHLMTLKPTIKTNMSSDPSSCGGTTSDGSPSFDLEWERTADGWKIVAIPYL